MNNETGTKDYVGVRKGLGGHSLGELEAQILDIIWDLEAPITAAKVFKVMYPRRELSYSTVMLTMSKLARKGILTQERSGPKKTDAFIYAAVLTREELGKSLLESVAERVFNKPLSQVLADLSTK